MSVLVSISQLGRFRRHFVNLSSFTAIQIAGYLIPVVTVPYFARTLTIPVMGQLAIATAAAAIAGVLIDFGIQMSGARFAARNADNAPNIAQYLGTSSMLKLLLTGVLVLALLLIACFWQYLWTHLAVFFWSLAAISLYLLFPQWLFQGLQVMPAAARMVILTRVCSALAALALVRSPADAYLVPLTQAVGSGVALAWAVYFLRVRLDIGVSLKARRAALIELVQENRALFSATAWGAAYAHGAVIIMGLMLSAQTVGYYSIAQRICQAMVSMFSVLPQTLYPHLAQASAERPQALPRLVAGYIGSVALLAAICAIGVFAAREHVYYFFSGEVGGHGATILAWWLAISFFTILSVSMGPVLLSLNLDKSMADTYRIVGVAFLILAPAACALFGAFGMLAALLLVGVVIAAYSIWMSATVMLGDARTRRKALESDV